MAALRKHSPTNGEDVAALPTPSIRSLSLADEASGPGINVVADHNDMLKAAFAAQEPVVRYPGVIRVAVIGGGSAVLWGGIALLIRSVLMH